MKRFFATLTVTTLLLFSLAGCSKKTPGSSQDTTPTPTAAVTQEADPTPTAAPDEEFEASMDFISFGGYFIKDDASVSIYLDQGEWKFDAAYYSADSDSSAVLSGVLAYEGLTDFKYSDAENELSFVYGKDCITIQALKGTAYTGLNGTYTLVPVIAPDETVSPEEATAKELLGRIALTYYASLTDREEECTIEFMDAVYENQFMNDFVTAYTDFFLLSKAEMYPDFKERTPYYAFSKDALNDLLLTASAGTFGIDKFTPTEDGIIYKDDVYYVPCTAQLYGEVSVAAPEEGTTLPENQILLDGYFSISHDLRYDLEITLTTSENSAAGAAGIQIDTAVIKWK